MGSCPEAASSNAVRAGRVYLGFVCGAEVVIPVSLLKAAEQKGDVILPGILARWDSASQISLNTVID